MARKIRAQSQNGSPKKSRKKSSFIKRWFWRLMATGLVVAIVSGIALVVMVATTMQELPSFQKLKESPEWANDCRARG